MNTYADWQRRAAELTPRTRAFINGTWTEAQSRATFPTVNPADGKVTAHVARGEAPEIDAAVRAARTSFDDGRWSRTDPAARKRVLLRLADLITANAEELALLDTLDMGKPIAESYGTDVPGAAGVFAWYAEAADKLYDEIAPTPPGSLATVRRTPLGVVGAVVPWNFPSTWRAGSWRRPSRRATASYSNRRSSPRCRPCAWPNWQRRRVSPTAY